MSIRQYSAQKVMRQKTEEAANNLYRKECRAVQLETMKLLTSDAVANSCIYSLTPIACIMAACGHIGVSAVLFIHQLCRCFIMYTQNFATSFVHYSEHSLSFERVNTVISFENELTENCVSRCGNIPESFAVTFQNVSAAYGNHQVLQDVSFTASPGECIGIVGESGSGKSTLVKALMQMIDYQGEIYIGGENCKTIARALLKKAPIYIFDEPTAALDADSEAKILNTIVKLKQEGKCILLITHRASTLHIADRILRIDGGKVYQI